MRAAFNTEPWMNDAACAEVGGDWWFPIPGQNSEPAKRICRACPVKSACLAYAVARDDLQGVWGGTSTRERARLRTAS